LIRSRTSQLVLRLFKIALLFFLLVSVLCVSRELLGHRSQSFGQRGPVAKQQHPNQAARAIPRIEFANLIETSKIHFTLKNSVSPQRYSIETMTGGVAVFDYNNDGFLDIFFTNGAEIPSLEKIDPSYYNRLFRNNRDGTFTDVTERAGLKGIGYSMGVAVGDYDNDGFDDLYITGVNVNQLLHNNGNGTFTDVTLKAAVPGTSGSGKPWAVTAGWFDYDNDGLLDLLVVNYLNYHIGSAVLCHSDKYPSYCSPDGFQGTSNILYHNKGDGTFTNVSLESHMSLYVGKGMGVAFADYDNDGFTDVFISNDTYPNFLLHNNGDGTFTDRALDAGVAYTGSGATVAGMGTDFRDIDNDGKPDIFLTAMFGNSFPLYHNIGNGQFEDVTGQTGLAALTGRFTGWGAGIYDFDNDGHKDLFAAGAEILDNSDAILHRTFALPDLIFRNNGNMAFGSVDKESGILPGTVAPHRGAAFGDLNNDGKIDVVVTVLNGAPELLMNRTQNQNHWITMSLIGVRSNRDGLGTKVKISTPSGVQFNQATTAVGYNSSSSKEVHFGLGNAAAIDRIELQWPSGLVQTLTHVNADRKITVTEGRP
jgi:hypothetical protein